MDVNRRHLIGASAAGAATALAMAPEPARAAPLLSTLGRDATQYGVRPGSPDDQTNPVENYLQIREELRLYDEALANRPELVVITKSELTDADAAAELLEERIGRPVLKISSVSGKGLPQLLQATIRMLDELAESEQYPV